jgi:dienelactone hydrolase
MADLSLFDYDGSIPPALEIISSQERDACTLQDVTYDSPMGGRVPAHIVRPHAAPPFAGAVFVHWGEGDGTEFLEEAIALAPLGLLSLLIDAPYLRPVEWRPYRDSPRSLVEEDIQLVVDIRRGIDLLVSQPGIDAARLGYVGHSLGATRGGIVAAVEKRIRAYVLMAGSVSLSEMYRTHPHPQIAQARANTPRAEWEAFVRSIQPLDAIYYIGQSAPAALFFQYARNDEYITTEDAALYFTAASHPKQMTRYDAGHALNAQARVDRANWLAAQLSLTPLTHDITAKLLQLPQPEPLQRV